MAIKEDVENCVQEEMRQPLMQDQKNLADGQEGSSQGSNKGHPWMVYFSTFVAVCGSYSFGSCAGYSSPTQSAIREDLSLSLAEYSVFGSILTFGAMIGAITSGPIADFIGRKGAMRMSAAVCVAGWLCIYFAEVSIFYSLMSFVIFNHKAINPPETLPDNLFYMLSITKGAVALDIGRLATGYAMGVFSYVVPVFIAEIAPKNLRGALTTINQFMICAGVSVAFIIGTVLTWRVLALTGLVPCGILVLGLFLMPESPRWLAKKGNQKGFEAALQKLRGKDVDISEEADEIQDYIATLELLPKPKIIELFQKRYSRSVIIGVGLMVCQQLGGINGVCFYTGTIFETAGFSSSIGTITYACIQVVVTGMGAFFIDRAGRKPLLLVSGTGLVLGCALAAIAFYMKVNELALQAVPALAVTGILLYIASFSVGMGAVPWVVMSEIFPINIKGRAGSLATLVNWFVAWLCSYTFNFLMTWSTYGTFILYGAINALAILFVVLVVPETKGRTLEEIQAAINT